MNTPEENLRSLPSRRDFIALGVGAFVVAALPLGRRRRRDAVRRTVPVMGTLAEIAVVHHDRRYAQGAINAAFDELRRIEGTMTRFRDDSDIGRANVAAARAPVAIRGETASVIAEALRWADLSDGAFDPALGRAVELWDVPHRHTPPDARTYRRFAGRRLYRSIELGRFNGAAIVRYDDPDIALDLGGIAKGYAVDCAVCVLREWGVSAALVNVGGDLYALGHAADGEPWRIGIQSPADPAALIGEVPLADGALATSGDYIRYFDYRGRRYHHLLDPRTGEPRLTAEHSITIAADTCMVANAAATAAFGDLRGDAHRLLSRTGAGARLIKIA